MARGDIPSTVMMALNRRKVSSINSCYQLSAPTKMKRVRAPFLIHFPANEKSDMEVVQTTNAGFEALAFLKKNVHRKGKR